MSIIILCNHCINNSYFPAIWKDATIIPLPKKAEAIEPKDFRPISMTSNVGKILEDVLIRQLRSDMTEGTIPWTQFGFTPGHSTVDALSVFKEDLASSRRMRLFTAVCSLDIRKAFDSVWHMGLVYKVS